MESKDDITTVKSEIEKIYRKTHPKIFTSQINIKGKLFEEVKHNNKAYFINKEGKYFKHIEDYYPIEGDTFHKESGVKLPSGIEEYGNLKELTTELIEFIHQYVDISPFFETISAYYILLTQIHDRFHTIPYLRVLGNFGVGKTRYLDTIGYLCYKAMITTGTTNAPGMFRFIDLWKGTLLVDESRTKYTDEDNDTTKIFNSGFEQGRSVMRIDTNKEKQDQINLFEPYSTKIIAARNRFDDKALESRFITEIMKDTSRKDIPITLNHNFFEKAGELRNKLLKFRFDYYNKEYTLSSDAINKIDIENRLKQSLSAFFILLSGTDVYDEFIRFAIKYNTDTVSEVASSYEGIVVEGIFNLLEKQIVEFRVNTVKTVKSVKVTTTLNKIEKENEKKSRLRQMLSNTICLNCFNYLNLESKEFVIKTSDLLPHIHNKGFDKASSRSIGRILTTLGFERKRIKVKGKTVQALDLKLEHLNKLFKKYIPEDMESEEPQLEVELEGEE